MVSVASLVASGSLYFLASCPVVVVVVVAADAAAAAAVVVTGVSAWQPRVARSSCPSVVQESRTVTCFRLCRAPFVVIQGSWSQE